MRTVAVVTFRNVRTSNAADRAPRNKSGSTNSCADGGVERSERLSLERVFFFVFRFICAHLPRNERTGHATRCARRLAAVCGTRATTEDGEKKLFLKKRQKNNLSSIKLRAPTCVLTQFFCFRKSDICMRHVRRVHNGRLALQSLYSPRYFPRTNHFFSDRARH